MARLVAVARNRGIRRVVGEALNDNQGLGSLLSRLGPVQISHAEPGVRHFELALVPGKDGRNSLR